MHSTDKVIVINWAITAIAIVIMVLGFVRCEINNVNKSNAVDLAIAESEDPVTTACALQKLQNCIVNSAALQKPTTDEKE